jgi:hypothetical protein
MTKANETQVGGTHYAGAYQHWDLVWDLTLPYFPAQITRYVSRWNKKNGVQDLEKALHYLDKYTELVGDSVGFDQTMSRSLLAAQLLRYLEANPHIMGRAALIIRLMCETHYASKLQYTRGQLEILLRELKAAEPTSAYVNQGGK